MARVRAKSGGASVLVAAVLLPLACGAEPAEPVGGARPRVIALAPSIARVIQELDALEVLVAVDEFSRGLPGLEPLPSVGGLYSPDLERAVELRPTLVLAVRSAQQSGFLEHLRRRGVRVEELEVYTLDEVLASFARIGELIGEPVRGHELAARVRGEVDAVARRSSALPRRSVALVLERDPLYVAGGGGFPQALIAAAGGSNVFGALAEPYPRVSLEALAERAPDVLIDATPGADAGEEASRDVERYWRRFPWVKRVAPLARGVVTLPGPELGLGARTLLAVVHPEVGAGS